MIVITIRLRNMIVITDVTNANFFRTKTSFCPCLRKFAFLANGYSNDDRLYHHGEL